MKSKLFENVNIGDVAVDCDCYETIGLVLAKGSFTELSEIYFSTFSLSDFEEDEISEYNFDKCIAISQNPSEFLEKNTSIIMLYDQDPSSACVLDIV